MIIIYANKTRFKMKSNSRRNDIHEDLGKDKEVL